MDLYLSNFDMEMSMCLWALQSRAYSVIQLGDITPYLFLGDFCLRGLTEEVVRALKADMKCWNFVES